MHDQVKNEVQKVLDKANQYNFPLEWEDTELFLTGNRNLIEKELPTNSLEWNKVALNFLKTMPKS